MWVHKCFLLEAPQGIFSAHFKSLYSLPRPFVRKAVRRWFRAPEQRYHPSSGSAVCTGAAGCQVPLGLHFDWLEGLPFLFFKKKLLLLLLLFIYFFYILVAAPSSFPFSLSPPPSSTTQPPLFHLHPGKCRSPMSIDKLIKHLPFLFFFFSFEARSHIAQASLRLTV